MDQKKQQTSQKRKHHLRVPVLMEEKEAIEHQAKQAGLSVARYLRDVGQGCQIKSIVDYEQVSTLMRINGDLGRLGGLLKLWLADDARATSFGKSTLRTLLKRIESTQDQMRHVMTSVIHPRAKL
jgi:hypothetical protein